MVNNPKFPHWCKVIRSVKDPDDQYAPATIKTILEGVCHNQIDQNGSTVWKEGVLYSDSIAYLPLTTMIDGFVMQGDTIEINDNTRIIKGMVIQFEKGNLGIRIWHDGLNGSPQ